MSTLSDKFAAFYQFEASGNATDETANGLTLTDNNTVSNVTGKVGNAAEFALVNSEYFSRADTASLKPGDNNFSIVAWVNLASKPASQMWFVAKYTTTGNQRSYGMYWDNTDDRFKFIFSPDGTSTGLVIATASTFGAPSLDTYYFLHASYDATGNLMSIAVNNGTANTASQTGGPFSGTSIYTLGALGNPTNYLSGRMDQVGQTTAGNPLTADELTFIYNAGSGRTWAEIVTGPAAAGQPTSKRHGGVKYMALPGRQW